MIVKGLAHVCISAGDLAATERFYRDGLGFAKVFDFYREGARIGFYLRVTEGTFIEVFEQAHVPADATGPLRHLCFEVADIEALTARLREQGHKVTEKQLGKDHSWQCWTADPSGVQIEFHQYTEHSSQLTGEDCRLD